jgi:hypothetical protein
MKIINGDRIVEEIVLHQIVGVSAGDKTINGDLIVNGEITMAPGWRDLVGQIEVRGVGSNDPSWAQMGAGPFRAYKFGLNDEVWITYHIDHDYAPGSLIYLHTHWTPSGTDPNSVKWQFDYTITKGHEQQQIDVNGTIITSEQTPEGTAWTHHISEIIAGLDGNVAEPDALVKVRVKRITNGGTDNTDDIFLLTTDCHYQADRLSTPNKAPNFYG